MTITDFDETVFAVLRSTAWLGAGVALGGIYFLLLRWNVGLFASGRRLVLAAVLPPARFAALAIALALIAKYGGTCPLLFTAAGIAMARLAALRLRGPSPDTVT